jgi:hypothetical protein
MPLALLTITIAQMLDLGTFVRMVAERGAAAEANPLVAQLLIERGLPFVAVAKIAALAVIVAVVVVLGERTGVGGREVVGGHPRLVGVIAGAAVLAGLVGGWTNALALTGIRV